MTTILFAFLIGLSAALILTPLARFAGNALGAMDHPDERKVHAVATPRIGGVAIVIACLATIAALRMLDTGVARLLALDRAFVFLLAGALLCFATGLADDFRALGARRKLALQILAATVAFSGGTWIGMGFFQNLGVIGFLFSYALTVFWFLLFINAVNLIDGLDGLAGGVCFFTAMVMVVITLLGGNYVMAMLFAALGGSILGFLRYNFSPASVFLGDGGSYFLGYAIAGLSIMGNLKEQAGAAVMIPLIAMGVPLFDTLLSTVRRFLRGRAIFGADKRHLHHRLVGMGLTTRRAVLLVYAITLVLCVAALVMVHLRDGRAGLVLVVLGAGAMVLTKRLGYFDVLGMPQLKRWVGDVSHVTGFSKQRRMFLDVQIEIEKAQSPEQMWPHVVDALRLMEFEHARLYLTQDPDLAGDDCEVRGTGGQSCPERGGAIRGQCWKALERGEPAFAWDADACHRGDEAGVEPVSGRWYYRLELPLVSDVTGQVFGILLLSKNHGLGSMGPFSLLGTEHLRRAMYGALDRIAAAAAQDAADPVSGQIRPERAAGCRAE